MIEGLKIRMTFDELSQHLRKRSAWHLERAADKEDELPGLRETRNKLKNLNAPVEVAVMNKGGGYNSNTLDNTISRMEQDIIDHKNKSAVFAFFSEHLFPEDYILDETDLQRMEVLKDW